ncbi:hypothetical protein A3G14_05410 [Candidatus Curtissbacteria bacterium RIFCSPLOWO2_12_FULL_38_9]|uniref:EamA domain-containing protein n=1 Tax=Candidatus Curtissbacteria bacterium RIFCSPLOWO2_12_FULL_38_9 TaxID=1797735 RepID=A0A1F5IAF3_9BACT|nr:MAG: hypothetical protein A3G14_05410 [Candidatus Curtissbacteria bacterium RIFCSPLOWO2_12_FULL_38_9]
MSTILQNFYALLLVSVTFNVTANILLKTGVIKTGGISSDATDIITNVLKVAVSPYIVTGLTLYGLSFLIWLRVLSFNDLSRSYPIFATIVFLMTTIGSVIFLKEHVSIIRIVGIAVMLTGIFIVSRS